MSIKIRYPKKVTDAVGNFIGNIMSRGNEKVAKGFNNMANLIKYKRESKGAMPNTDYRDINFRTAVMARHAKSDFMAKDNKKRAKRYYQDDYSFTKK